MASCGSGSNNIEEIKLFPVKNGDNYRYVNRKGEIVINAQFSDAALFYDGLALASLSGGEKLLGYIDEKGKYVINAQYVAATSFREDLAWVVEKDKAPAVIDRKGEVKFTLQQAETVCSFSEGLAAFSVMDEKGHPTWGFVNKKGEVKINPQFETVGKFSNGLCAVKNEKWGYIDKEGRIVINQQFDGAAIFENGRAVVDFGNKCGVIDKKGKYIINPQFDAMTIDGDLFSIQQNGKYGWCDSKGTIVINPQFDAAISFGNNKLTSASSSGRNFGYINKEGKFVINPQFQLALPFNGTLAIVISADRIGFIDKEGKYIVNPQFEGMESDVITYILGGVSQYYSVNTDYFNVDDVISVINIDSPEGFTEQSTFADVKAKYGLNESKFSTSKSEHKVISSKLIAKNTYLDFSVTGSPYDMQRVQNSGLWTYYSTKYVFNGTKKPKSYTYVISNKSSGKVGSVGEAIVSKLSGYTKHEGGYGDLYIGNGKKIYMEVEYPTVSLSITFGEEEDEGDS